MLRGAVRALVIDADDVVRATTRQVVASTVEVDCTIDPAEAVATACDVVVLGEPALLGRLRAAGLGAPVLLVCDQEPGEAAGADGWLLRSEVSTATLIVALRHVRLAEPATNALERVTDGFVSLDRSWRYTYVNRRAGEILGRHPSDLIGRNSWEMYPEGVGQPFQRAYERALREQAPVRIEEYFEPWGRWFENRVYPSPDGLSIFFTDITDARRATDTLRDSERRLRDLVEHLDDKVLFLAKGDRPGLEYTTPSVERLLGVPVAAAMADLAAVLDRFERDDRERLLGVGTAARRGERAQVEVRLLRGPAGPRWMNVQMYPILNIDGGVERIVGVVRDVTDAKRAGAELERQKSELSSLTRQLLQTQEAERRHIARELHDDVGPTLAAIKLGLEGATAATGDPELVAQLARAMQLVDEGVEKVRNLSLDLRPSLLDDFGLATALRSHGDRQSQLSGVHVTVDAREDIGRFAPAVETACFRIAQEALQNASRHGRAEHVRIALAADASILRLVVSDDGVGFDTFEARERAQRAGRLGVTGMRERAEGVDGTLEIESKPGQGSIVRATFPRSLEQGGDA